MAKETSLTQEYLKSVADYNPDTGIFRWKKRYDMSKSWNTKYAGNTIGWNHSHGYIQGCINYKKYFLHRLAWFYVHGVWPLEIDHRDGDKKNNRISNLRETSHQNNAYNRPMQRNNSIGLKGVRHDKRDNSYYAGIRANGKNIHLGTFKCPTAAHLAYCKAAKELHGEFARTA